MAVKWDYTDYWACYKANPEKLQDDVNKLHDWLIGKSTRVQLEVVQDAPREVLDKLMDVLTFDCQIALMR